MKSSRVPGLVAVGGLAIALGIGGIVAPVAQAERATAGAAADSVDPILASATEVVSQSASPEVMSNQPSEADRARWEKAITDLVNDYRASKGLSRLTVSQVLIDGSRRHSEWMLANNKSDQHAAQDGSWTTENIATGQTPDIIVEAWKNSPLHNANLLNTSVKTIGVGIAVKDGLIWATQRGSASLSPAVLPTAPTLADVTGFESAIAKQINDFRANNGMNRLAVNPVLAESARGHADWMAVNNKVVGGPMSNGSWNSELTGRGNGVDVIWNEWTSKDSSKKVLLKPGLNTLGVGVAIRDGQLWVSARGSFDAAPKPQANPTPKVPSNIVDSPAPQPSAAPSSTAPKPTNPSTAPQSTTASAQLDTPWASGAADIWALTADGAWHYDASVSTNRHNFTFIKGAKTDVTMLKQYDWFGTDKMDLFERKSNGDLTLSIDGKQTPSVIGGNWGQITDIIPMGGPVTGEERILIARHKSGDLYGYRWANNRLYGVGVVGKRWTAMSAIFSLGNTLGDAKSDILAINGSNRTLYGFAGKGGGELAEATRVGGGWGGFTAFTPGRVNDDQLSDLAGLRGDGLLFVYRNNGRGFEPAMHFGGGFEGHDIRAIG